MLSAAFSGSPVLPIVLAVVVGIPVGVLVIIYLVMPVCRGVAWIIGQAVKFAVATVTDLARLVGIVLTGGSFAGLSALNVLLGRWSAAQHFGRALEAEGRALATCIFRLVVGHPARLFGLKSMIEGLEQRLPQVMAAMPPATNVDVHYQDEPAIIDRVAPGSIKSGPVKAGQFNGYKVIGTLAGGGSGGKLYIAQPEPAKLAALSRQGFHGVGDVVIKTFSVATGSSLPQIVRESRALEAAKKLGLVLEHDLSVDRFFYVMRYVPGDSLGVVSQRLHARCPNGLVGRELQETLSYAADLLATLREYHKAGMWHKDVKPDNIIVSGGRAHLVDFGLVTPLRSSMTLTTHGTEYFRDPEMVRLALKGVKVHEVDGAKFDIYATGAVLFSMIENSFPAHGGLSQISRPCPEAVRWVVRRAMTDYDKRYPTAEAMLLDLQTIVAAAAGGGADSLRPADLPSVRMAGELAGAPAAVAAGGAFAPAANLGPDAGPVFGGATYFPAGGVGGGQTVSPLGPPGPPPMPTGGRFAAVNTAARRHTPGRPAHEQLKSARSRAADARARAQARFNRVPRASRGVGAGVVAALLTCGAVFGLGIVAMAVLSTTPDMEATVVSSTQTMALGPVVIERVSGAGGQSAGSPVLSAAAGGPVTKVRMSGRVAANGTVVTESLTAVPNRESPGKAMPPSKPASVMMMTSGTGSGRNLGREVAAQKLRGWKFQVVGVDLPMAGGEVESGTAAQVTQLSAALKASVGLAPVPGDTARAKISEWFATSAADGVDVVVWLTVDTTDPDQTAVWVVGRTDVPDATLSAVGQVFAEELARGQKADNRNDTPEG